MTALQCLILFWEYGPRVLSRTGCSFRLLLSTEVPALLIQYFSFIEHTKRLPALLRASYLSSLRTLLHLFPAECIPLMQQHGKNILQ